MISPQRLGFHEKEDGPKRIRVGVTGMGPAKLFPDTLKDWREDWLSGGTVPLNRFHSSRR